MTAQAVPSLDEWWTQYKNEYDGRTWRDYRLMLSHVVRHAAAPPLLDVGCGYGFLVECARQFGMSAVGLESSEHAINESRRRHPQADVRQWQAGRSLDFPAQSIGVAVLNQVVDHFTLDENRHLFTELQRVLTSDGVLLVYSPSRFNRFETDTGHVTFFSPSEFRQFVGSHGFDVLEQPFHAQPILGHSTIGRLLVRAVTQVYRPERLAATIDLVARKR